MIVKDEEKYIGTCLESIKDYVDEMIIVDTGSTDKTVEICKSFGAKIFTFPWNGSFSDARNYGIERATGDWILWLDADEKVDAEDVKKLREVFEYNDLFLCIHLINYAGDKVDPNLTYEIAHTRLFQNHKGIKFKNRIHETLNTAEICEEFGIELAIKTLPIKVYHYGYLEHMDKEKNKSERNIGMLKKELKQSEYNPWFEYYIAGEYYRLKKYTEAFEYINRSIYGFLTLSQLPPAYLYQLKYSILITSGNYEGAWPGIEKAIQLYPDYVDLHFYKGVVLYNKGSYEDAVKTFDKCLEIGEGNLLYLSLKGFGTFQALYYKGACLEKLGQIKEAAECYRKAFDASDNFIPPMEALSKLTEKYLDILTPLSKDNK
jgi:glycosyltransferase involved in cell wall biosynthesis